MIYYNLGFILTAPAIGFISSDRILLTRVTAEVSEGGNITKIQVVSLVCQSGIKANSFASLSTTLFGHETKSECVCYVNSPSLHRKLHFLSPNYF